MCTTTLVIVSDIVWMTYSIIHWQVHVSKWLVVVTWSLFDGLPSACNSHSRCAMLSPTTSRKARHSLVCAGRADLFELASEVLPKILFYVSRRFILM